MLTHRADASRLSFSEVHTAPREWTDQAPCHPIPGPVGPAANSSGRVEIRSGPGYELHRGVPHDLAIFPDPIQPARDDDGDYTIRLNPEYAPVISRVEVDLGEGLILPVEWEPAESLVNVGSDVALPGRATVIFFGPDGETPIWAERVRFSTDGAG